MNCEICGSQIKGQPYKTKIDNTEMITCKECSSYGKVLQKPKKATANKKNIKSNKNQNNRPQRSNKTYTRRQEPEYELVEDYSKIIRQAREKQNLTQKKLGEKIYERESVIAHIESGKMVPDDKIARKIEKILGIKILEQVTSSDEEYKDMRRFKEATIGDIARIKRS